MFLELFSSKHKCEACGMEAKDRLYFGEKLKWFCRDHLMENFSKSFLAFPDKMVIFHPEFEKVCKNLYSYYPISKMPQFNFDKSAIGNIERLLSFAGGECSECRSKAQVFYFPKGVLKYSSYNPMVENIDPVLGNALCLEHALAKIQADLRSNPVAFDEGLYVPYDGRGAYISTYL